MHSLLGSAYIIAVAVAVGGKGAYIVGGLVASGQQAQQRIQNFEFVGGLVAPKTFFDLTIFENFKICIF